MIDARALVCAPLLALALSCASARPAEPGLSPEDVESLRAASASYVEAMRRGDWAAVAEHFTADAVRMPPNEPLHTGRPAIEAWLSGVERVDAYSIEIQEIVGGTELACVRARYAIELRLPGVPVPIADEGKALEVWERGDDGRWRMSHAIWNSDAPPPTPEGAR